MNFEPNYSDMKRFITSVGILFIALSIILPWLILKEPLDTRITTSEMTQFSQMSQYVIQLRQIMTLGITLITCCTSPLLVIGGSICLYFGINSWFNKESQEDKYADKIRSAELKEMTEKENELYKIEESNIFIYVRNRLEEYLSQKNYEILENQHVGKNIYELIIHNHENQKEDIIVKIKYTKKQWWKKLVELYFNFYADGLDKYKREYKPARLVCLAIRPKNSLVGGWDSMQYIGGFISKLNPFSNKWRNRSDIKFLYLREDELTGLTKEDFLSLFIPNESV